ncbi:MAG: BamA/TamA family outer membrane protein [Desulfotalea sp.]
MGVEVLGLEKPLLTNVISSLRIYQYKDTERLTEKNLQQLYKQGTKDIQSGLAPYGYYSPEINSEIVSVTGGWEVTYVVNKGNPITVGKLVIKVLDADEKSTSDSAFDIGNMFSIGDILDQTIYNKYKDILLQRAFSQGYLDANYTEHSIRIYKDRSVAHISLVLSLENRYKFGDLIVEQDVISDDLLKKYFPHKRGDPYLARNLFKLQEDLYRAGIFDKVVVKGEVDSVSDDHKVPILIKAEGIKKLNKYTVGAGYATDTGARVTLGWTNRLVNKSGHSFSSGFQLGERDSLLRASYSMPFLDPRYEKIITTAAYQKQKWNSTKTAILTGGPAIVYSGEKIKYNLGLEFRNENYDIGNTSGESNLLVPSMGFSYLFAGEGAIYRNSILLKNALSISGTARGSVDSLFSETSFLQVTVGARGVLSPVAKWRFIGDTTIGMTEVDDFNDLPPSLRFYAGGDNSVRGYRYHDIGSTDADGNVIGGKYLFTSTIEIERSFTEYIAVAVFWDMGSATVDRDLDLHHGVGVGGRLNLPFGQVKLDLACPISEDDKDVRLHFSMSGEF